MLIFFYKMPKMSFKKTEEISVECLLRRIKPVMNTRRNGLSLAKVFIVVKIIMVTVSV